ncbi:MAG TPA: helix-turn-helix domain-containing protein [Roseiflexaceae bacterium]|nr:helix-turn-helix domain-containing protein [Roseiflexaceae bacterium]
MTTERQTVETNMLTVPEVAAYLKISPTTVWRHCVSGTLPAFRVGRQWRIERRDLERWIANLKDEGATQRVGVYE